eukprot:scaffold2036_cov202-Prasinococcus_capsulatus_cf.AAC.3
MLRGLLLALAALVAALLVQRSGLRAGRRVVAASRARMQLRARVASLSLELTQHAQREWTDP